MDLFTIQPMELKDWVRAARESKGWSQTRLGEAVGRGKQNVSAWETGKHVPSYEQISLISAETGYPMPDQIVTNPQEVAIPRNHTAGYPSDIREDQYVTVWGVLRMLEGELFERLPLAPGEESRVRHIKSGLGLRAFRVKGNHLAPYAKDGHYLIVRPGVEPRPEDKVILVLKDGRQMVREMVYPRPDTMIVMSIHGGQQEPIDRSEIDEMYAVVAPISRSDWEEE